MSLEYFSVFHAAPSGSWSINHACTCSIDYTMINFVKPNLLGTLSEFRNRFANPIKNGQCSDSMPSDIRIMKQRAHVLHRKVEGCVQRKDYRVLSTALPPKQEYVISFRLTEVQDKLYRFYLNTFRGSKCGATDLFSTFSNMAKVWNHPWVLRLSEQRAAKRAERMGLLSSSEESSLDGFIVFGSDEDEPKKKKKRKVFILIIDNYILESLF